jgi:hypothetical protein
MLQGPGDVVVSRVLPIEAGPPVSGLAVLAPACCVGARTNRGSACVVVPSPVARASRRGAPHGNCDNGGTEQQGPPVLLSTQRAELAGDTFGLHTSYLRCVSRGTRLQHRAHCTEAEARHGRDGGEQRCAKSSGRGTGREDDAGAEGGGGRGRERREPARAVAGAGQRCAAQPRRGARRRPRPARRRAPGLPPRRARYP